MPELVLNVRFQGLSQPGASPAKKDDHHCETFGLLCYPSFARPLVGMECNPRVQVKLAISKKVTTKVHHKISAMDLVFCIPSQLFSTELDLS